MIHKMPKDTKLTIKWFITLGHLQGLQEDYRHLQDWIPVRTCNFMKEKINEEKKMKSYKRLCNSRHFFRSFLEGICGSY